MNIACVHLFNDRSGSPRVLKNSILAMKKNGYNVSLFVGSSGRGILSDLRGVETKKYFYRRFDKKIFTLLSYLFSQIRLFLMLLTSKESRSADVIYVNTLMPFAAGLFGWCFGKKVLYHVHEVSISPKLLSRFLKWIVSLTASKVLYVSNSHAQLFPIKTEVCNVVYNGYDDVFEQALNIDYQVCKGGKFKVLMLASLRGYKGINEFVEIAKRFSGLESVAFDLVLNDSVDEVERFRNKYESNNLFIHPSVSDPGSFYRGASLVLNLSIPDQWVETFGLTIVEAMIHGVPVIVPPVGGPGEIVQDGVQGYLIDSRDLDLLESRLRQLINDLQLMMRLSHSARIRAKQFSSATYERSIVSQIKEMRDLN